MTIFKILGLGVLVVSLLACEAITPKAETHWQPSNLLTESLQAPLHVHNMSPGLSWFANVVEQTHYRVQVASSPVLFAEGVPDLWDSGRVASSQSVNVYYQGKPLAAGARAYWRVRVWSHDQASEWSSPAWWEMGLLQKRDWSAQWIQVAQPSHIDSGQWVTQWMRYAANLQDDSLTATKRETQQRVLAQLRQQPRASLFRHEFVVNPAKTIVSAKLYSTAAGYYEMFINGKKISERVMDPAQTDFEKRILYNADQVVDWIQPGQNAIAVHLGSGWYQEFIAFSKPEKDYFLGYGQPAFIAQLELTYEDGSRDVIATDESWLTHPSFVVKEGIFSGELFDANLQLAGWQTAKKNDLSHWRKAQVMAAWPTQQLAPQLVPAIESVKTISPVSIGNPKAFVWVIDFGQNHTGVPTINLDKLKLKAQQAIFLRYGEWIDDDGHLNQKSGGGAPLLKQVDGYIAKGDEKGHWQPTFTWHGYRYLEITGLEVQPPLDAFSSSLLRSGVARVGSFESSDPLLNRIHDMALWGYESNLMSLPMDCPIRERAGWTGDAHAAMITANYNFDMENFWQKYLVDFETSEYIAPAVVPGKRSHGGNFDWAAAEVMLAWQTYLHHGDVQLLANQYISMLEYMNAGEAAITNNLIRKGYGDWCDPVKVPGTPRVNGRCSPQHTTPTFTSSALFAHTADLMSKISKLLGKPAEEKHFASLFDRISQQLHKEFYDAQTKHYGSQTADAMALMFEIAPTSLRPKIAAALNNDVLVNWQGHASVGALGQTYIYRALSDYGYGETAFNIFKAQGYPGYQYLFDQLNATTLWERKGFFNPNDPEHRAAGPGFSLNHPFHSGYDGWFYEGLGGIRPLKDNPGFRHFALHPVFPKALESVGVSYQTGYGKIISRWQRIGEDIEWYFEIPNNTLAEVTLPNGKQETYRAGSYEIIVR